MRRRHPPHSGRTLGFWHKDVPGSEGWSSVGLQYSYITKSGWSGAAASTTGYRQHGVHLFPLLPAVVPARQLAARPSPGDGKGQLFTELPFLLCAEHV